jgi:hypothetical protein
MSGKKSERRDPQKGLEAILSAVNKPPQLAYSGERPRMFLPPSARSERYKRSFNAEQLEEFDRLEVSAEQRKWLGVALRAVAFYTEAAPTLTQVRRPLREISTAAQEVIFKLESLLTAPSHEAAFAEARQRLKQAGWHTHPAGTEADSAFEQALIAVGYLHRTAQLALDLIPREETRRRAYPYPIGWIDEALRLGWSDVHVEGSTLEYPFAPSTSITSRFREIVRICYEAARAPTPDPERAVKAYVKGLRDSSPMKTTGLPS